MSNTPFTLPQDALVCIMRAGKLLGFAMVARREVDDLAAEQQPVVGLMAPDIKQLTNILLHLGGDDTQIVQVRFGQMLVQEVPGF